MRARSFAWALLWSCCAWTWWSGTAFAQTCPTGRYCFYVPPGLPLEASHSNASSRVFDIVISAPVRTVTGTYGVGAGAAVAFEVAPGDPVRIDLGASNAASGYGVAERRGVFIVADSPNLTVDHRETFDQEQYSETIKRHEIALGTRFRLGGYSLNREGRPLAAIDAVLLYAPTGATVTVRAPPSATLPFWNGSDGAEITATLSEGQTLALRSLVGRDIDGALLSASAPVAVSSGGRGWSASSCGDDGMDGLVPVNALGTQHVLRLPTGSYDGNNESRARVIADADGTLVQVNGAAVATLAAGAFYEFEPTSLSYVQTSRPALVWMNGSVSGCELDTVLIPPIALAPAVTELSLDFNVPASNQNPAAEMAILIATRDVPSIRLDRDAPTLLSNELVPSRPELSYVRFNVAPGNRNVRAASDFQAMLASRTQPSGLLAYYNPYRIPGCGDGAIDAGEGCDDENLESGDGCSAVCQVEPGYTCAGTPSRCTTLCGNGQVTAPSETCDDGNTTAGDGCNVTCRREVLILTPLAGSVSRDGMPVITGTTDVGASVTLSIGGVMTSVVADDSGMFRYPVPSVLADGSYIINAISTDVRGGASSASRAFAIDASTFVVVEDPAPSSATADTTPLVRGRGEPEAVVEVRIDGALAGMSTVQPDGRWEVLIETPLARGVRQIEAAAQDLHQNRASSGPSSFLIDDATDIVILQPAPSSILMNNMPELTGEAEASAVVRVLIDGASVGMITADSRGAWSLVVPTPLPDGTHLAAVESTDVLGNVARAEVQFSIDTRRAPLLFILNLPDGAYTRDPRPTFSGVADPGAHVLLSFDGVYIDTVTSSARGSFSLQLIGPLREGSHTLEAVTSDANGETVRDTHTFFYAPNTAELSLREPREGSVVRDATPLIAGSARAGARVQLAIDDVPIGEAMAGTDGRWTFEPPTPLLDGRHAVRAVASDGSANDASVEGGFFVDTRTSVTILRPTGRVAARPAFVGSAEPFAIVRLDIDGVRRAELDVGADGFWWFVPTETLSPGVHRVHARAVDALDNQAEDDADFEVDPTVIDADGDGRSDAIECASAPCADSDGDGMGDANDADDDGDGLPTAVECVREPCRNSDGDAQPDYLDADDDGDGRPTRAEQSSDGRVRDSDRDGDPDHLDGDDDGDGLPTLGECATEPCVDSDGDATPDYLDPDDDNDRIPTSHERVDSRRLGDDDVDRDGRVQWLDPDGNANGGDDASDGIADRDGDGTPDYIDRDTPSGPVITTTSGLAAVGGGGCHVGTGSRDALMSMIVFVVCTLVRRRARPAPQ